MVQAEGVRALHAVDQVPAEQRVIRDALVLDCADCHVIFFRTLVASYDRSARIIRLRYKLRESHGRLAIESRIDPVIHKRSPQRYLPADIAGWRSKGSEVT